MRRAAVMLTPVMLASLLVSAAGATVVRPLALGEQVKKAEVIVQARVADVKDAQQGGFAWKVYPLTVTETVVGDASALPRYENAPALWVLAGVDGAPTFAKGDEAVLLLYKSLYDSPLVGFNQGVYRIKNGKIEGQSVSDVAAFKKSLVSLRGAK